ncbi:DoxX family protein [Sphingomonas jeddahensis]|uniref:DoxX n=1 Tax=Sphingomonas jeddahensis TaxID=1915074 RepID=A0A1V2EYR6_9SPHN|nr:hypothetical protein [Sphingomonas jeddahensis]ONF97653.1 hypothetical protein SPHI_02850 [Sphingomonas jeddahensis]
MAIVMEGRWRQTARWLLILFYALGGVGHLVFADAMARIVPSQVPAPHAVVIVTGVLELIGVAALASVRWRRAAGYAFAAYALCVWPANMRHAALDLASGTGLPLAYHAPRLLLQPLIIWWSLWASGAIRGRRCLIG